MAIPVIYELQVADEDDVRRAIDAIGSTALKSQEKINNAFGSHVAAFKARQEQASQFAKAAALNWEASVVGSTKNAVGAIERVSDGFKSVSRDIDAVAGEASAKLTKTASDVLGVAAAFGSGGLLGVIALTGVAVGALSKQWESENELARKAIDIRKQEIQWVKDTARAISEKMGKQSMENILIRENELILRRLIIVNKELTLAAVTAQKEASRGRLDEFIRFAQQQKKLEEEIADEQKKVNVRTGAETIALARDKNRLLNAEAREALAEQLRDEEAARKTASKFKKFDEDQLIANLKNRVELERKAQRDIQKEIEQAEKEVIQEKAKFAAEEVQIRAKFTGQWVEDYLRMYRDALKEVDPVKQAEKFAKAKVFLDEHTDSIKKGEDATKKASDADKKHADELRKKREEMIKTTSQTLINAAATTTYGLAVTAVTPVVSTFTDNLARLGEINRENYRDLLFQGEELPRIIAKTIQAKAAALAAEATGKSIFEAGESLKEEALGIGTALIPGLQAESASHFLSATVHSAASVAYGLLGTAGAGVAIGVGASRGQGGLVGLTREEREEQERRRGIFGGGGGGGGGGGSFRDSGVGGRGGGNETTVVNITYAAGSITPADDRRARRVVSGAVMRAQQDGFERRRMAG